MTKILNDPHIKSFVVGRFRKRFCHLQLCWNFGKIHFHYCLRHNIKSTLDTKTINRSPLALSQQEIKSDTYFRFYKICQYATQPVCNWNLTFPNIPHFFTCFPAGSGVLAWVRIAESQILSAVPWHLPSYTCLPNNTARQNHLFKFMNLLLHSWCILDRFPVPLPQEVRRETCLGVHMSAASLTLLLDSMIC